MIKCAELNRVFDTKKEMFKALKSNKDHIISLKKGAVKNSDGFPYTAQNNLHQTKSIEGLEKGFIYPVINTTKYMDSHHDVHFDGIWNKSIKEQQGNVYYLVNHQLEIGKVIAYPENVEMMIKEIEWKDLGKNYSGTTQALIFKTKIFDYSNKDAAYVIENRLKAENSIRMQYVKMNLAINDESKEFKEEKAYYDKHINTISNKEMAEELGYFWGIEEAKIYKEGSMVLLGSNDATPIIYEADEKSLHEEEAAGNALQESRKQFLQNLIS